MTGKLRLKKNKDEEYVKSFDEANDDAPYSHLPSTVENNNFGTSLANHDYEDDTQDEIK